MKKDQITDFTEGKIFAPLIRFALPILLALCLQSMYGAVDLLVVGRFSSAAEVSGVSTGSQMMNMATLVITGLSMGTTIQLGQAIGRKEKRLAGQIIGSSICFFAALAAALTVILETAARSLTALMQAPAEAFEPTVRYFMICSAGFLFIAAYNLIGSIFRGIGDSKTPLIAVSFACVFNIAGDLFFVATMGMGAAGAALATVMAQALSVLLCLHMIRRRSLPFDFSRRHLRFDSRFIRRILTLGFPIALQDALVNISFLVIMAIVNQLGVIASAGVGVAEKLCAFIMLVPSSFSQSLSAIVAQNFGAGKYARARKTLACGIACSIAAGVIMAYFAFFQGTALAGIFSSDAEVVAAAAEYLKAYGIDTLLTSFLFCYIGYFNGCGRTRLVMIQGIVGAFGVRIPVSYLMSRITPVSLFRVGLATPASTLVQIILLTVCFCVLSRRENARTTD